MCQHTAATCRLSTALPCFTRSRRLATGSANLSSEASFGSMAGVAQPIKVQLLLVPESLRRRPHLFCSACMRSPPRPMKTPRGRSNGSESFTGAALPATRRTTMASFFCRLASACVSLVMVTVAPSARREIWQPSFFIQPSRLAKPARPRPDSHGSKFLTWNLKHELSHGTLRVTAGQPRRRSSQYTRRRPPATPLSSSDVCPCWRAIMPFCSSSAASRGGSQR
mmetsp:Transcript_14941/g.38378  ORF Transcript_14941/g.38378 Transcript_14941/m.38378 type:complete len:224 (+) Transcript_14941:594-1265(+)